VIPAVGRKDLNFNRCNESCNTYMDTYLGYQQCVHTDPEDKTKVTERRFTPGDREAKEGVPLLLTAESQ
jgi:hypothetical protein